ncbi:MAG: hypothetical protein H7124_01390 [Phycisphaerales bacterium]|nr:hypothetical protein [Hyphomonadaceae bacterium]
MPLTNTELSYYDSNVLRLPKEKRTEYHAQVDNLILELCGAVREKTEINVSEDGANFLNKLKCIFMPRTRVPFVSQSCASA